MVKEVSIRWWYALPEWPPVDFDYSAKLKELGYRVLDAEKFKLEADTVNGLQKCVAVDGYKGVYKSKTVILIVTLETDRRPTQRLSTNTEQLQEQEYRRADINPKKSLGCAN